MREFSFIKNPSWPSPLPLFGTAGNTAQRFCQSRVHLTAVKYLQTNLALSLPVPCQTFARRVRIGAYRNEKLSDFLTINTTLETAFPRVVNNNFAQSLLRLAPPCRSRKRTCTGTLPCAIWVSVVQSGAKIITSSICGRIGLIRFYHWFDWLFCCCCLFLGYANEVGEAFRPIIKKIFVHASYAVSIGYVLADTADKSRKQYAVSEEGIYVMIRIAYRGICNCRNRKPSVVGHVGPQSQPVTPCSGKCLPRWLFQGSPSIGNLAFFLVIVC